MSNLGSIVVSLEANVARFESDLGKAEQFAKGAFERISAAGDMAANAAKGIGLAIAGIGAGLSINTLVNKFESVTASLAGLKEMSERTGASVENLSGMAAVARIGGRDLGEMETAVARMNKSLHANSDESKGAGKALAALGLDINKLKTEDPAQAFLDIAKAQEKFADSGGKSAVMMDILGKTGSQQIPLMHDLADQNELVAKATDAQAAAADKLEKDLKRLTATKEALYRTISVEIIPVYDAFIKALIDANNETDGVRKAAKDLAADGSIRSWAEGAAKAAGFVVDAFDGVVRTFNIVGKTAGAALAQTTLMLRGDFKGAMAVGGEWKSDIDSILNKPLFSDKLAAQLEAARRAALTPNLDNGLSGYTGHGGGSGKTGRTAKDKSDPLGDWLKMIEAQTKPALEALDKFDKMQRDAETSGMDLTKAEKSFYDLIASDDWKNMAEPWKDLVREHFEAANAAEKAAKQEKELNDLLKNTPTAKLEEARGKMLLLADAFEHGKITAEQFIEAANGVNGVKDELEKVADDMSEFTKQAAHNMQNAFSDFLFDPFAKGAKDMLRGFSDTVRKMAAQALSANILNSLFGDMGKTGKVGGFAKDGVDWLSSLFTFANGGIMTGAGPVPLRAYAGGGIADSAQVAVYGEGSMPEAFVPLPDGRAIPVKMQDSSASAAPQSIRIVNAFDTSVIGDYLGSDSGARVILNAVRRNAGAMRQVLA